MSLIEEALGPIRPEVVGWETGKVRPDAVFSLGQITRVSPEAAEVLTAIKIAAAARCIPFPTAVMLILARVVKGGSAPSEGEAPAC